MKKRLFTKRNMLVIALCLSITVSAMPVMALNGIGASETSVLDEDPKINNINITENELPFVVQTNQLDANTILLTFPTSLQETAMLKSMANNEEITARNGVYTLNIGEEYYYSVVVNSLTSTEYYSAMFDVIEDDADYIAYSNIVKNVVYDEFYDPAAYETMGYTTLSESEGSNNYVSGAVRTYSDADNVGTINSSSDIDWWKIKFNYNGQANFWLGNIPTGCNYSLYVYDSTGSILLRSSLNTGTNPELISMDVTKGIDYTVKITSASGFTTNFQYLLRVKNYPEFSGNKVYKIASVAYPSQYLSVYNGHNANQQNVELGADYVETSSDYTNNVRMRFRYRSNVDAYLIGPICSFNGYGRTLDVYNNGTIVSGANVQTWESKDNAHEVYANEQYYTFEECGIGIVIRMKYTTNFVVNTNGTNINILTYNENSNAQKWIITEDVAYNQMETQYKSYGWGWMYYYDGYPVNLRMTSSFGYRYLNANKPHDKHTAIDIGANDGDSVYAATDGVVTQAGFHPDLQYFVVVKTDDLVYGSDDNEKLRVIYQHMLYDPKVSVYDTVVQALTHIGYTGQGHMHFGVATDGCNRLNWPEYLYIPVDEDEPNNPNKYPGYHTWGLAETTNPLLFYDWDQMGFTYTRYDTNNSLGTGNNIDPYAELYSTSVSGFSVVEGTFTDADYYSDAETDKFYDTIHGYDKNTMDIPFLVYLIREMDITRDEYKAYLDALGGEYSEEAVDIVFSNDDDLINETFHSALTIYHEGEIYTVYDLSEMYNETTLGQASTIDQFPEEKIVALYNNIQNYNDLYNTAMPAVVNDVCTEMAVVVNASVN